jgi:hypothetical protein
VTKSANPSDTGRYCEDARSAMLFHYMLSGDDRLARQAITAYAASVMPDGLVCGRYPAHGTQIITGFALFWVLQVCDHMMHFNDPAFAKQFLSTIDGVLGYFERKIDQETGLVSGLSRKYWSFVDWHGDWKEAEDFKDPGVPFAGRGTGTWSYFSMLYAYTLKQTVTLLEQVGRTGLCREYLGRAEGLLEAIRQHCFDGQYFVDGVVGKSSQPKYSQHAQIWGVLSGAVPADELPKQGRRILQHAVTDEKSFAVCSYPMQHYAFRALAATGLYDQYYHQAWTPWRKMMANNLTTWEEDSVNARSDCHEWSSLPIWEYTAEVAGVHPLEAGWAGLRFAPRLGLVEQLQARVNLGSRGLAEVSWNTAKDGSVSVRLTLPGQTRVVTELNGVSKDHGMIDHLHVIV